MHSIANLAEKYNLVLIEDCAQAHFAKIDGNFVGTFGDACTFSFYPGKNLGAFGDAGFVGAKSAKVLDKVSKYLDHGRESKYRHDILGSNYRMDAIQGAILSIKLKYILDWTTSRQKIARLYNGSLRKNGYKILECSDDGECVYHLYPVEVANREEVMTELSAKGIKTGVHYPIPLHLQPALNFLNYNEGDFPVAEQVSGRVLSLPIFPELTQEKANYIVEAFLNIARP